MCFFPLSSRVTGPKVRGPVGAPCGLMRTAALRSKRMIEPSGRRTPVAVRTTTAFITWPFLTRPRGIAPLTETTIVSPIEAYLRLEPPSTLMHWTRLAPELSATSRLVCICIMAFALNLEWPLRRRLLARQHRPPLLLGDRRTLLDPHHFAHLELVLLVMGVIVLAPAHGLLQHGMGKAPLDADHHGLVVLVAHHDSLQHAFRHRFGPNSSSSLLSSAWPWSWPWVGPWPWVRPSPPLPWAS